MAKQGNLLSKTLVIGIIFLFVVMSITPSVAVDTVEQSSMPSSNGKTLYVGGSGEGNYSKIQDAIDDAKSGDTVFVYNGTYYENIIIDKTINMVGENRDKTIIFGDRIDSVIDIFANQVYINGFTIKHSGEELYVSGINISSDWNIIRDNIITNNPSMGIRLFRSNYNLIEYNLIKDNSYYHIYLKDESNNNTIKNNTLTASENWPVLCDGIWLSKSHNNLILNNEITGLKFTVGISLHEKSIYNVINKNIIHDNPCDEDVNIIQITQYSNFNFLSDNQIKSNNGKGIKISSVTKGNIIYHNNFINNTMNAYDEGDNIWDNGYPSGGNYWDDYTGEDSDGDGIGDIPYPIPVRDNEDRFPLMKPYGNQPPVTPEINGKRKFKVGEGGEYPYRIYSTDPNDDDISYTIDWGCGSIIEIGPYPSGEYITINVSIPLRKGTYIIFKIKALDIFGAESNWAILEVTVPRTRTTIQSLFQWLFDRFPLLEVFLRAMNLLR